MRSFPRHAGRPSLGLDAAHPCAATVSGTTSRVHGSALSTRYTALPRTRRRARTQRARSARCWRAEGRAGDDSGARLSSCRGCLPGASAHRDVRRRAPGMASWRPPGDTRGASSAAREVIALPRGLKGVATLPRATAAKSAGYLMTVSFGALRGAGVAGPADGPGGVGDGAPGPPGAGSSSPKIIPWPVSRA